mgnify:CR=1 FL=1
MIDFVESEMRFQFCEDKSFYIEKSHVYDKRLKGNGVSSVECITLFRNKVVFIEAKSSAPNPETSNERFADFIHHVVKKFKDSLSLCESMHSGLWPDRGMGKELAQTLYSNPEIQFILIIRNHKEKWSVQMQDALRKEMNSLLKIWKAELLVINGEQALKLNLVRHKGI